MATRWLSATLAELGIQLGARIHLVSQRGGIAAAKGNPIHAAQAGQVIWAGWDVGGLGRSVKINHCNHVSTVYGHMDKLVVKAGDLVLQGDPVGLEGSTGWSTGPHLHFMVEVDNVPVDPMSYYNYNTNTITHNG